MSAAEKAVVDATDQMVSLYSRYKILALTTAATVILEEPTDTILADVERFIADCRGARTAPETHFCERAAVALRDLLESGGEDNVIAARATHRELRRDVWTVAPCEYVPCCADDHQLHRS